MTRAWRWTHLKGPQAFTRRFRPGPDAVRYQALLEALVGVPGEARTARFRCWAALACRRAHLYSREFVRASLHCPL